MANQVVINVEINDQDAARAFAELTKDAKKASESVVNSFDKMDLAIASFAGNLAANIFQEVISGAKDLFNFFLKDGIAAANAQEDAINAMNNALRNTGLYSAAISKELEKFSSELQNNSKYADEVILRSMALLQSIGNLNEEGLKKGTQVALDMSAALGIDLDTAMRMVGKAAEGNISAFQRYGVTIEKGKNDAETFANTVEALNAKFGGSAASQIDTYSGAMKQMSNTIGDTQERFGEITTQNPAVIAAIKSITDEFKLLEIFVKENQRAFDSLVAFIADSVVVGVKLLIGTVENAILAFRDFKLLLEGIFQVRKSGGDFERLSEGIDKIAISLVGGQGVFGNYAKEIEASTKAIEENKAANERWDAAIKLIVDENKAVADQKRKEADEQKVINDQLIAEEKRKKEEIKKIRDEFKVLEEQEAITKKELDLTSGLEEFEGEKTFLQTRLEELALLKLDAQIKEQTAKGDHLAALKSMEEKAALQSQVTAKQSADAMISLKKKEYEAQISMYMGFANLAATVAKDGSKVQFAIQQAAAIASSIIATLQASALALATPPGPPATIPLATATKIAGFANTAAIAAQTIQGFNFGGIVDGNSYSGDKVMARVNSREMILNQAQQSRLFDIANGKTDGMGGINIVVQGNIIADNEAQIQQLMSRINDQVRFNNTELLATGTAS